MDIPWSIDGIQAGLWIAIAIVVLIVLYHVLFIVVDVRKIVHRIERVTGEVESVVEKPLAMTESIVTWVVHFLEGAVEKKRHGRKK